MPVTLIAGADDLMVNFEAHSARLHDELMQSDLHVLPDTGHMAHYVTQELFVTAIEKLVRAPAFGSHATLKIQVA